MAAQLGDPGVERHPPQPAVEMHGARKPAAMLPGAHEDFLHQLLGLRAPAAEVVGEAVDRPRTAAVDRLEGVGVAGAESPHEARFGDLVRLGAGRRHPLAHQGIQHAPPMSMNAGRRQRLAWHRRLLASAS
jgi:hypothetical protein